MNRHNIFFAEKDDCWFIRLVGEIRYPAGNELQTLTSRLHNARNIRHIVVDLNQTTYIDSTNLGLLARLAQSLIKLRGNRLTLLSQNDDINVFLNSMGFSHVAVIIHNACTRIQELEQMPDIPIPEKEQVSTLLEAHQTLMDLDKRNQSRFRDVVEALKHKAHG